MMVRRRGRTPRPAAARPHAVTVMRHESRRARSAAGGPGPAAGAGLSRDSESSAAAAGFKPAGPLSREVEVKFSPGPPWHTAAAAASS